MVIRTLDLFAGAGGLTLGVHQAGFETVAAVEYDRYAAATFALHSPLADIHNTDIQDVDLSIFRNRVDVVIGGPPCQPFSSGGLRAAHKDERDMLPSYLRALELLQPSAFLMENVPGLVVGDRLLYLGEVIRAMRSLGYMVEWRVLSAVDYGVPQKRRRLFVIGMRDCAFRFPRPTHGPGTDASFVTVDDVLPPHPVGEPNMAVVTYAKKPDLRPSPYDGLMFNGGGRPINRKEPSHTILASAGGNKTHFFDDLGVVSEYHRHLMAGEEPRVGTVPGARRLTTVESALLQTFPHYTTFVGPRSVQYRQIGNAVPPALARAVAQALAEQLGHRPDADDPRFYPISHDRHPVLPGALVTKSSNARERNVKVHAAILQALQRVDAFLSGETVTLPSTPYRRAADALLGKSASVRTAGLFLAFYALQDPAWHFGSPPVGSRGEFGDKLLCEGLSTRHITLHNSIKAYGENLGWKGNISSGTVQLEPDARFHEFVSGLEGASADQRSKVADYLAQKFAESRRITQPLPPVGPDILTFARARVLFYRPVKTPSEGHIQQFLIAALLREHRKRFGIEVVTHHPHAADEFDRTAGDIEEKRNGQLLGAYEVTVRPDWQNRISGFRTKMDKYGLKKYVIIASAVNEDPKWAQPASMLASLEPYERDIAVVDIHDVVNVFAAELSAEELRGVVNGAFNDLCDPRLSNRDDFKTAYREVVSEWLDEVVEGETGDEAHAETISPS